MCLSEEAIATAFGSFTSFFSASENHFLNKSIGLSAQYSDEDDIVARWSPTINPSTNFVTFTPNNLDKRETLTAIVNFPINPNKKWNFFQSRRTSQNV